MDTQQTQLQERISSICREIEDLKQRWPAHSVKPSMVQELERLEDELGDLTAQISNTGSNKGENG